MNNKKHEGQCHCGNVVFEFTGLVLTCYTCHCTDCQKSSGTAFSTNMLAERKEISIYAGTVEIAEYEYGDRGRRLQRHQCSNCKTALWLNYADKLEYASIQTGTFISQEWFQPIAHIWMNSALRWISIPPNHTSYETQPELPELIKLWQESEASS